MTKKIEFNLNGKAVDLTVDPDLTLMWVLRTNFGLTGTKFGCGLGFCGSCTVLLENEPTRSCMLTVGDVSGLKIVTIEVLVQSSPIHIAIASAYEILGKISSFPPTVASNIFRPFLV